MPGSERAATYPAGWAEAEPLRIASATATVIGGVLGIPNETMRATLDNRHEGRYMGSTAPDTVQSSILDRFLPHWDFRELHSRRVAAPAAEVKDALLTLRLRDLPLSSLMSALRLAPAMLANRRWDLAFGKPVVDLLLEFGFVELGRSGDEFAFGAVGRFWRLREETESIPGPEAFERFDQPGYVKGVMNFRFAEEADSVTVLTETRVLATDNRSRRLFRPYWVPVRAVGVSCVGSCSGHWPGMRSIRRRGVDLHDAMDEYMLLRRRW